MKVKMKTAIAGSDFSHAMGNVVDFDPATAKRLVDSGQAEYVTVTKPRKRKKDAD